MVIFEIGTAIGALFGILAVAVLAVGVPDA